MKILVYSSVFYPNIGGIENLTLFLVREFVKKGHEVKVITEQVQDPLKPLEGIEVVHSSEKLKQLQLFFWSDLVYMPNITLKGVWLFAFNPFKKWIISHNDFGLLYTHGIKAILKKNFIKRANAHVAVSQSLADFLPVQSVVIHNCYNSDLFKLYPDERRDRDFIFVGRLVSQKGCELLIRACSELQRDFTLTIVGEGFESERLRQLSTELGLNDKVHFAGFRQNEELARYLNRHRTMIVPSLDVEGFGIVALEGLACGCRMVVSNAGGLSEAVKGHSDAFEPGNKEQLITLLHKSLDTPYQAPGPETMAYLNHHSKEKVAEQYLKLFAETIHQ